MNFKKTVAIATAAGALAAISVPAMAFENEFHGIYNLKGFVSNYENGGSNAIDVTQYNNKLKANNFIEQRARLIYIAKASDDLKLVTQFELDSKFGGDKSGKYGISSDAGSFDADGISIETKHVYLDFNLGKDVKVKTGIQPIKDGLKGIFVDADLTGIQATSKMGAATVSGGFFRYKTETSDVVKDTVNPASLITNTSTIGHTNTDLFMLDGKYAVNKDLNVGGLYYLQSDYVTNKPATTHVFGVNADAKVGIATVSGFLAAQVGHIGQVGAPSISTSGYAANVAAKLNIGPGSLKTGALFLTGDNTTKTLGNENGRNTNWTSTASSTYAEGGMMLLTRTGVGGTSNDRTINGASFSTPVSVDIDGKSTGLTTGLILYTLGYDATITPKLYANANLGMAWVAKSPGDTAGDMIGTELNVETGYKIYDNLTAKVQVAYVVLGGLYKGMAANNDEDGTNKPANPYTARVGLSYAF